MPDPVSRRCVRSASKELIGFELFGAQPFIRMLFTRILMRESRRRFSEGWFITLGENEALATLPKA